jgi:hypothetical protein
LVDGFRLDNKLPRGFIRDNILGIGNLFWWTTTLPAANNLLGLIGCILLGLGCSLLGSSCILFGFHRHFLQHHCLSPLFGPNPPLSSFGILLCFLFSSFLLSLLLLSLFLLFLCFVGLQSLNDLVTGHDLALTSHSL